MFCLLFLIDLTLIVAMSWLKEAMESCVVILLSSYPMQNQFSAIFYIPKAFLSFGFIKLQTLEIKIAHYKQTTSMSSEGCQKYQQNADIGIGINRVVFAHCIFFSKFYFVLLLFLSNTRADY